MATVAVQSQERLTESEYLALERAAEFKSEFENGEVFAMSGGTAAHSLLASNVQYALRRQLDGKPCLVFTSDMRVRLPDGNHKYPDISALCGEPEYFDDVKDALLNPTLLVEVLSASTEAYDRGAKFRAYRQIPSLVDYVLIAQDQWLVEHYEKRAGEWILHEHSGEDAVVQLRSLQGAQLKLRELYDRIVPDSGAPTASGES